MRRLPALGVALALALAAACAGRQMAPGGGALASVDRTLVRYQVAGGGSPVLLFIHCWSCDASYWETTMAHFAPDHLVIAVDLPGHGASGMQRERWTVASFAEDVRVVVEALDLEDVILVGSSMGGTVALEAAVRMPSRVSGIVTVDAFHDFTPVSPEQADAFLAPLRANFAAATEQFVRSLLFLPDADPALVERIATDMAAAPPAPMLGAMASLLAHTRADVRIARTAAPAPLAVINGSIAPTDTAALREVLDPVYLTVLEGVGHFPMAEAPAVFHERMRAALDAIERRGGH